MKSIFALSGVAGVVSVFVAVGCGGQILDDRRGPIGGGSASSGGTASDTGGTTTTTTTTGVGDGSATSSATTAGSGGAGQTGGTGGAPWTPHGSCLAVGVVDPNVSTAWPDPSNPPSSATIDTVTMKPWYQDDYTPQANMFIGTFGDAYILSDGSTWGSGAGSASYGSMSLDHISHEGPLIHYHMAPVDGLIVERTDYDSGNHSAHFRLETLGDWTITATSGSASGTLVAQGIIMMDEPANYIDSRFSYLSSPLCSAVSITITYSLLNAVFDDNLFGGAFSYIDNIVVDAKSP